MVLSSGTDGHEHLWNSFENERRKRRIKLLDLDGLHLWMDFVQRERDNRFHNNFSDSRRRERLVIGHAGSFE